MIDSVSYFERVSFARFFDEGCSYGSFAIGNNPLSPDAVHPMHMSTTTKFNVSLNSLVFYYEPNVDWIVQEVMLTMYYKDTPILYTLSGTTQDCIDMDCDGPKHSLVRDLDGRFVGTYPTEGSVIPLAELRYYL